MAKHEGNSASEPTTAMKQNGEIRMCVASVSERRPCLDEPTSCPHQNRRGSSQGSATKGPISEQGQSDAIPAPPTGHWSRSKAPSAMAWD